MNKPVKIAPSILSADFARLGEEVVQVTKAGADYIHVDVMDGHFVPNLTIGPTVIKAIRPYSNLMFDVHLMIENPERYIDHYAKAGADIITVHAEAVGNLKRAAAEIRAAGKKVGMSIKPNTPPDVLKPILPQLDLVLVMSVEPGFGGQSFMPSALEKIKTLRAWIDDIKSTTDIEVDGGINEETAGHVIAAGANILVAGSAIFRGDAADYRQHIKTLRG